MTERIEWEVGLALQNHKQTVRVGMGSLASKMREADAREHSETIDGTLYVCKRDLASDTYVVRSFTEVAGHAKPESLQHRVPRHHVDEFSVPAAFALEEGVTRLKPQVEMRAARRAAGEMMPEDEEEMRRRENERAELLQERRRDREQLEQLETLPEYGLF